VTVEIPEPSSKHLFCDMTTCVNNKMKLLWEMCKKIEIIVVPERSEEEGERAS
jgi:hypothetical protein